MPWCPCAIASRPRRCSPRMVTKSASSVNGTPKRAPSAAFHEASSSLTIVATASRLAVINFALVQTKGGTEVPPLRIRSPGLKPGSTTWRLVTADAARRSGGATHAFGDDADLLDARALGGVDHFDDVAIAEAAVGGDEQRLVLALLVNRAQAFFEFADR